jgi:hypothetical protein
MTPRRLDWTLRTRGTVIADWPQADRAAAVALLRSSPAARAVLADALAREDADPAPLDRCALMRMQGALKCALWQLPPLSFALRWSVLVACTAAGLYLGAAAGLDISADSGMDGADGFVAVQSVTVASNL